MKVIKTTFWGPTNARPAKVTAMATDLPHKVTVESGSHEAARDAYMAKMGWDGETAGGCLNSFTMVWVFTGREVA